LIRITGAPDFTYRLQRSPTVTGTWSDLAMNAAPASGLVEYRETSPPPGQAFQRTVQPWPDRLTDPRLFDSLGGMTLTLPDPPVPPGMTAEELRLELACALYARGKLTKVRGAELAGVDFFTFQQALKERRISTYTLDDLDREVATLNELFPDPPIAPSKG